MSRLVVFLLMAISVLAVYAIMAFSLYRLELDDLEHQIDSWQVRNQSNMSLSILGSIENLRTSLENRRETLIQYRRESRIQAISTQMSPFDFAESKQSEPTALTRLVGLIFRQATDSLHLDQKALSVLGKAYYLERIQNHAQAAELYQSLEQMENLPSLVVDIIRLHRAYCLLVQADFQEADRICISLAASEEPQIHQGAQAMRRLIDRINQAGADSRPADMSPLDAGLHYYFTLQYHKARETFNRALTNAADPVSEQSLAMRFFLARTLEREGEASQAVRQYSRILSMAKDSPWAMESARRTVMIDTFYQRQTNGVDLAYSFLAARADPVLSDLRLKPAEDALPVVEATIPESQSSPSTPVFQGADLHVISNPSGASIFLNGEYMGVTPMFMEDLVEGWYFVKVRLIDREAIRRVKLETGKLSSLVVNVAPKVGSGNNGDSGIKLRTDLRLLEVSMDDIALPLNPELLWKGASPGRHVLRIIGETPEGDSIFVEKTIVLDHDIISITLP